MFRKKIKVKGIDCSKNTKRCSKYTVEKVLVEEDEIKNKKTWVGANPVKANLIFRNTIKKKLFSGKFGPNFLSFERIFSMIIKLEKINWKFEYLADIY